MRTQSTVLACFIPLLGTTLGLVAALAVDGLIGSEPGAMYTAKKLLLYAWGFCGWAMGTVGRGQRIHCGGSLSVNAADKARYQILVPILLSFAFLSGVVLGTGRAELAMTGALVILLLLTSEVGWGGLTGLMHGRVHDAADS